MKRNGLLFVILSVFAVFSFSPALADTETSEIAMRPGEWKCDWSAPLFSSASGTAWITVKSVENDIVKGEVQVFGSQLVGYEKFTGKLDGNTLIIPLQRASVSLTIEKGEIVGGVSYGTMRNNISSCFRMK